MGGGLASFLAPLRGTDPPCILLPASVRSDNGPCHSDNPPSPFALRISPFDVGPSPFGPENGSAGAREDGMPLRISEPERSEAPRAGPGEREDGSREGGWEPRQSDLGNTPSAPKTPDIAPTQFRPSHPLVAMCRPDSTPGAEAAAHKKPLCGVAYLAPWRENRFAGVRQRRKGPAAGFHAKAQSTQCRKRISWGLPAGQEIRLPEPRSRGPARRIRGHGHWGNTPRKSKIQIPDHQTPSTRRREPPERRTCASPLH